MKLNSKQQEASFTYFCKAVQHIAATIIANSKAATTRDELAFIHRYYISNRAQQFAPAAAQCACSMLECLRTAELKGVVKS